jgi:hypothetical protein
MPSMPSRGFAVLLFFGLFAAVACGSDDNSSGSLGTAGAGESGAASFPCAGPSIAGSGEAGEGGATGTALSCFVGQSFCYVLAGRPADPSGSTVYLPQCRSFSGTNEKCAATPTCDCFCSEFGCETQCRCNEVNGFATVICDQI